MSKLTLINNKLTKEKDAKVSIFSNAFQRGHGVFETLRTYKGKKFFKLDSHLKRLFKSAKAVGIDPKYSKEEIKEQLDKITKESKNELQRIKVILIEGQCIITSHKLTSNKEKENGVSAMSIQCNRSLPEVKSTSYLASYLSHEIARKQGCYDAILIDENEEVYEGAYSNVFWVKKGKIYTREKEVLKGITRETIIKDIEPKTSFKNIKLNELLKADEIFLTQSVSGITPVIKVNNSPIGDGTVGEKTKAIIQKFKSLSEPS